MFSVMLATVSTLLVDVVIAFLVIEMIFLAVAARARGAGMQLMTIANSAAGLCLVLALRFALHDAGSGWIMLAMSGAFLAHLADLGFRRQLQLRGAARDVKNSKSTRL